jgi:hypothetical protein
MLAQYIRSSPSRQKLKFSAKQSKARPYRPMKFQLSVSKSSLEDFAPTEANAVDHEGRFQLTTLLDSYRPMSTPLVS